MINFIICDDEENYRKFVYDVITRYMMKNKYEYKIHIFKDFGDKFLDIVKEKLSYKIYILDIEAPTRSGIDVGRIIRVNDINSVIIFLTGHQELGTKVIENVALPLAFINKFENAENKLINTLDKAFDVLMDNHNIRFKDNGVLYTVDLRDILYITVDNNERKNIIKTDYCEFRINMSLNKISELLTDDFIKTHRACIVNKKRIASFDKSERLITLDNGEVIDLVSTRFDGKVL